MERNEIPRKKRKFNVIDLAVLIVLIGLLAFAAYRFFGGSGGKAATGSGEPYRITFLCNETPEKVADMIALGEPVTDDSCYMDLGKVVDFRIDEARVYTTASDGKVTVSGKPGYKSAYVTVEAEAVPEENCSYVTGWALGCGHSMVIRVGYAKLYVWVYDMTPVNAK